MGEDGQSPWRNNGSITDEIEPPGFFQIGDENECAGLKCVVIGRTGHPKKPEGGGKPSSDPKPYDEAGYGRNDDKKFQILRF
jgi:hypothetical protein